MARPKKYNKLPANLYKKVDRRRSTATYRYKHPQTGKFHSLGTNESNAIEAAYHLNNHLMTADTETSQLMNRVLGKTKTFSEHLNWYENHALVERRNRTNQPLANKTLSEYRRYISVFQKEWGHLIPANIHHGIITKFLNKNPPNTANKYRSLLHNIFRYAVAENLLRSNPVDATIKRQESKTRERLPLDWYQAIYKAAEEREDLWFRNALDIARYSLLRREDIVLLKFEHLIDGTLQVIPKKTQNNTHKALAIEGLTWLVEQCRDSLLSPFLIHRKPQRMRRRDADRKEHYTQVMPNYLSHAFQYYRDEVLHLCDDLEPAQRPSFHEIRAMGADLYRQAGWSESAIQALLGHADKSMTDKYLEGHGIRFEIVKAGKHQ